MVRYEKKYWASGASNKRGVLVWKELEVGELGVGTLVAALHADVCKTDRKSETHGRCRLYRAEESTRRGLVWKEYAQVSLNIASPVLKSSKFQRK